MSAASAVVTGIGVVAPNGADTESYWTAVLAGAGGIGPITRFDASRYPVRLAGQVDDFVPGDHLPSRLLPQTDHVTRLSLYAAEQALSDSAVDLGSLPDYAAGVSSASTMGGFEFGQRELQNLWSKGGRFVSAYQSFAWFYAVNTGQVSIRHGLRGPGSALVTDQAGGLDAVGHARRQIRKGTTVMITGGVDGALCPLGLAGLLTSGALSTAADPARAYRPFAADADGHVPGEGGAFLVLEEGRAAHRRGAHVYGELAGYAAAFDPGADPAGASGRSGASGPRGASAVERVIRGALADARLRPEQIEVVFADGSAVRALDRAEAEALAAVFGPRAVPVTAPKAGTGRLYAGGGSLDLATALLSIRDRVVPHTPGVDACGPDYPIDLVLHEPRSAEIRHALVLAAGRGGFHAAAVVRRAD